LFSRSTLHAKLREFDESIKLAEQASNLLILRAPERSRDIGLALVSVGRGYNALKKYDHAAKHLEEAKRYLDQSFPPASEEKMQGLDQQLRFARTSGYGF